MYISLKCRDCDNTDCDIARQYIPDDSQEGCTRRVDDLTSNMYHHLVDEVLPFAALRNYPMRELNEGQELLYKIYSCPIGRKLDVRGKASTRLR